MRYVARDCKFVIAWLFGVIWGAYAFAEAIPNQLMQLWSSQREEIASCKLTYHSFLQMDEQIKPLSRVELHNLMEETRPWESPSDLSGFLSSLVSDAYTLPTLYVTRTFVKDGERYSWRSDESNTDEIRSDGILQSTKRVRGEYKDIVIRHEGLLNGQAILERLRIIPWPKNMAAGDWQITMEGTHSDLVLPSNDGSGFRTEWKVDSLTGSVLSRTVSSATEGVVREWLQREFATYVDNIEFPSFVTDATYSQGKLKRVEVTSLVDARFNEEAGDDGFKMPAELGTVIFDEVNDVSTVVKDDNVPDATAYIRDHYSQIGMQILPDEADSSSPIIFWVLFVSCSIVVALLAIATRNRWSRRWR